MSKIRLAFVAVLLFGFSAAALRAAPPPAGPAAEAKLDVLLDTMRANRKALIAVNLALTGDEAAKFWPVYDRYQKEINALGDRLAAVVLDYSASFRDLSNDKAMKLMEEYLSIEAERVKVRRAYLDEFAKIVPGRTVARFYQIENKIDAVLRYDLAGAIPVVDEAKGVSAK